MSKLNHLSLNCLAGGHGTQDCRNSECCKKWSKHHHTSLQIDTVAIPSDTLPEPVAAVSTATYMTALEPTLQMTILLESPTGKQLIARALLDPDASISLNTKCVVQHLQLQKQPNNSPLWEDKESPQETVPQQ